MRRRYLVLGSLVAIAVLLAGCGITPPMGPDGQPADLRPYTGFTNGTIILDAQPNQLARFLDGMKATGSRWLRVDFLWPRIQPNNASTFDWTETDRVVAAARQRGINILAMPDYTPAWARPAGSTDKYPPTNLDDYVNFVRTAAARYKPLGLFWWQIWNEPNNWLYWAPLPDPDRYAQMLQKTSAAIHSVLPGATVLTGGLGPGTDSPYGLIYSPYTFLQRLYNAGIKDSFQAVGYHPYSFPLWPMSADVHNTFYRSPDMYNVMVANGDAGKKVWATEVGYPTGTYPGAATEADQAAIYQQILWYWFAYPFAGPLFLSSYIDTESDPALAFGNMGLYHYDGTAKPSLATWISSVNPANRP